MYYICISYTYEYTRTLCSCSCALAVTCCKSPCFPSTQWIGFRVSVFTGKPHIFPWGKPHGKSK